MKRRRRTEITVETEQVLIIKSRGRKEQPPPVWCAACAAEVRMVTPEEAALISSSSLRSIYRQVEVGHLHFRETADGRLFICLDSLKKLFRREH